MFYGFPTILLESLKDEVSDFVILQLAIISGVGMLMMDNISEDQISLSSNLLSLWFDERVKLLGFNGMKLKSHIITHLPVIAKKFGNITKYSCFAGEGLIQTLGRMISQRTENNSLNQIKKRFKDLHMACYVIRKEEEVFENVFMNISNVFRDIFKAKIPLLHQYKFIDKIDFKGFSIRASMNGFIDRDNFLITQEEKDGEIFYKPGILLAVAINEKKEMLYFVKELVVIKKMLFNERFNKITLTTGLKNLINVVDDSNFFKKYFIIDNCYKNLSWVTNDSNITVIKNINRIYSKALIIESISQTIYVCPMLHSFEHN
uniref:Uncharacterized protein n=1 Tax=Strongyloides venezuelensis TaxID=75913 RepID=A0A0K0EWR2_STRVS